MSLLEVNQLQHGFGDRTLFKNITFRILRGEHIGLVGPNGAGKTTLMNILTGQLLPDNGHCHWHPHVKVGFLEQHSDLNYVSMRAYLKGAFEHLYKIERDMLTVIQEMSNKAGSQLEKLLETYGHHQDLLEQHEFYTIDAKVEEVAMGLGLDELGLETEVTKLSGGQRTKLILGKLLLQKPDVLLLDEPTNYLDTSHIEWLETYLKNYPHAFVLISHDTTFMNKVVNIVYHLEHQQLTRYVGNYEQFEKAYELRKQQQYQAYQQQQQEIKKLEGYIQKNKARASTAKQAKSREKRLEKIDRIEGPTQNPRPRFKFGVAIQPVTKLIVANDLVIGYDEPLFSPINLTIKRGEKVALVGHNGVGKTTTLRTLLGFIKPLGGSIHLGDRLLPAYFEQQIETKEKRTPLEIIWHTHTNLNQKEARQALARAGLKSEQIFQPLHSLSGGEQTKVRLCQLMLSKSNCLILDEPTNHLDVVSKEELAIALKHYEGTIILVSHEAEFYEQWATKVLNVEVW